MSRRVIWTPETGATIMQAFLELQQKSGTTLILVTHDLKLAQTSDRILQCMVVGWSRRTIHGLPHPT